MIQLYQRNKCTSCVNLFEATKISHFECIQTFLTKESYSNINKYDDEGFTALHLATIYKNVKCLKLLIDSGADVSLIDENGLTPFHTAIANGCEASIFDILIESGSVFNAKDKMGRNILHYAAQYNSETCLKFCLEADVDVNSKDIKKMTPLHLAAAKGSEKCVRLLISNDADTHAINLKGRNSLHLASLCGSRSCLRLLLESGANPNVVTHDKFSPLHYAGFRGHLECLELLLDAGTESLEVENSFGNTPLYTSTQAGNAECVAALIRAGANPNIKKGEQVVVMANPIFRKHPFGTYTPLGNAAFYGHYETMRVLLANGAKINFTDNKGNTPLHSAAEGGLLESVIILLENDFELVKLDETNNFGFTALHLAVKSGKSEIVVALLGGGADPNIKDSNTQKTPLHLAVISNNTNVIMILLNANAKINELDDMERTPMHYAAYHGYVHATVILCDFKASLNILDNRMCKPLDWAQKNNNFMCVEVLEPISNPHPLFWAIRQNNSQVLSSLILKHVELNILNQFGLNLLSCSASYGYLECVETLLQSNKLNINWQDKKGSTALHYAAKNASASILSALIKNSADFDIVDKTGKSSLHYAAEKGYSDCISLLLEAGAKCDFLDNNGYAPLHYAVRANMLVPAKILMKKKESINLKDSKGCSPLHYATANANAAIVTHLIENGADFNLQDDCGNTPSHIALNGNKFTTFKALAVGQRNSVLKFDILNDDGFAPLHYAAMGRRLHMIQCCEDLFDGGLDFDVQDTRGRTCLHLAAEKGYFEIIDFCVKRGADVGVKDKNGNTALDTAIEKRFYKCTRLLENVKN